MDYTKEEITKLRQEEEWLKKFNLTDDEFYEVVNGITRVILGSDSLAVFYDKIVATIKDKKIADKITLQAAMMRFLPFQKDIAELNDFIKRLGGTVPPIEEPAVPEEREINPDNTAKMVFSSTDEEEIRSLPVIEHRAPSADDYAVQAQAIIKDFGFTDKDEVVVKRLQNFIVGKLRDVRDDIELLEVLTKSRKIGGLELEEEKARFLIKLIKDKQEGFHNGEVPEAEVTVRQKIEFPIYQESLEKKTAVAAASEPFKPLTLEEKKKKDGFAPYSPPSKGESEGVMKDALKVEGNSKEIVPSKAEVFKTPPNLPPAYGGTGSERGGKNASIQDLPSKDEVYPIIEEEDGLPVIRMPEEVMVAPVVIPQMSQANQGISWKNKKVIKDSGNLGVENNLITKKDNNKVANQIIQEIAVPKTEPKEELPVKKITNLPPAKPEPYIAPAKTLPPKPAMMSARRPSLDDVKFVRKLIGPIEELETMTIIDFRRISADPVAAAKKIKEKVILLEKELYTKRAEGIAAWNKSEVSRFYRLLGQASMSESRSIEQIIAERQQAGKPTLTIEEFNAIMELNKELRY